MAVAVRWRDEALTNLDEIYLYIARDKPRAAGRMVERLIERGEQLRDFPRAGRASTITGVFELVVPGTPYILFYKLDDETAEILYVRHGRQNR